MNNKGFAIGGILYSLFILFLLILVSVLGGLQSKKNSLMKSMASFERGITGNEITEVNGLVEAPVDGKYQFSLLSNNEVKCYAYLKKGTNLNDITFVSDSCNQDNSVKKLEKIISFEEE